MPDVTPPDLTSAVGMIRALIPDMNQLGDPTDSTIAPSYLFSDGQLGVYLALAKNQSIKRAAAAALEVMGSSELYILKVLTENDLATNGAVVAAQWGARAQRLRAEADDDEKSQVGTFLIGPAGGHGPLFDGERAAAAGELWPWPGRRLWG